MIVLPASRTAQTELLERRIRSRQAAGARARTALLTHRKLGRGSTPARERRRPPPASDAAFPHGGGSATARASWQRYCTGKLAALLHGQAGCAPARQHASAPARQAASAPAWTSCQSALEQCRPAQPVGILSLRPEPMCRLPAAQVPRLSTSVS